ncbi:MAG TPA: sugar transferase [Clostridia bacterium]|nr:sugar transferase [Clostridia bacterium]
MYGRYVKRILDIVLTLLVAPFAALLTFSFALAVIIEDGSPAFYNAVRVGRGGKEFIMYKLRSMRNNSPDLRTADGATYNAADDPRTTKVGKLLRRSSVDELPQLLNVFKGQMSLIGPRPDLPDEAERYTEAERRRLEVRPGITGYSQVYGRNSITYAQKYRQDVYYVDNLSFELDAKVFSKTIGAVLGAKGVYVADDTTGELVARGRNEG